MGFGHRETDSSQIAVFICQLEDQPGSAVLNQLKTPAGVSLLALILHPLFGVSLDHLPFKKRGRWIPTQRRIPATRLKNRTPEDVEEQNNPGNQPDRSPAVEGKALTDQKGDHTTDS
ncbi:MAG: Uncharacterised protein [Cyanobium sp. ARS6]|nr:MAG: Uncharacterised protein [Cyanobium sp. ARS6]